MKTGSIRAFTQNKRFDPYLFSVPLSFISCAQPLVKLSIANPLIIHKYKELLKSRTSVKIHNQTIMIGEMYFRKTLIFQDRNVTGSVDSVVLVRVELPSLCWIERGEFFVAPHYNIRENGIIVDCGIEVT